MRKKRLLFISEPADNLTGFGTVTNLLLKYLYKTGKYEICNLAQQTVDTPELTKFPWKMVGALPNDPIIAQQLNADPSKMKAAVYGAVMVEKVVKDFKPDVIFSINDSWGNLYVADNDFFKHIPTVCWTTFDSLPLMPDTIEKANKITNYWSWAAFAVKEFHKLGHTHVKTQYPPINTDNYFPLPKSQTDTIRKNHGLTNDFLINFTFRNQGRKLVPTLIEGFAEFQRNHPDIKNAKLLLVTNFEEGWNIKFEAEQYGVPIDKIVTPYVCSETGKYFILPYLGKDIQNPETKRNTLNTVNIKHGLSVPQLNEVYNIADLYIQPCTSGGCEMPCVEAALTEKIVVTCNYSFGEDIIDLNDGAIPIDFVYCKEFGTNFLKSQPSPSSIAKILYKVYIMKPEKKKAMEVKSREWALTNYSIPVNGKKFEDFIDPLPLLDDSIFDYVAKEKVYSPQAEIPVIEADKDWIIYIYKHILDTEETEQGDGYKNWKHQLESGVPRDQVLNYFRKVAFEEQQKQKDPEEELKKIFTVSDKKKVLIAVKESIGDIILISSLLKGMREKYPAEKYSIFFATQRKYADVIAGNPYIDFLIDWQTCYENELFMIGQGNRSGFVDHYYYPAVQTQRFISYLSSK